MFRATLFCALACLSSVASALPVAQEKRLLDGIETAMKASYVFPEKVPGIMRALRGKAAAGDYRALDEKAFAKRISLDLRTIAADGHMQLRFFPDGMPKDDSGSDDPTVVAAMHREGQRDNWGFKAAEVHDEAIGVLRIDLFYAPDDAASVMEGAMRMLHDTDGLILDLRNCHGGEPDTVARLLSYFLPAHTHLNTILGRGGKVNSELYTSAVASDLRYDKPVRVLIGRQTASACEEAAYDLQVLGRAMIVGETSFGAASPGEMKAIDEKFALFVPNEEARNPVTKGNWEGVGVKPNVEAPADSALERALDLARTATRS